MLKRWLWLSFLVLFLDQASKLWVDAAMQLYESIDLLPFFHLTYVQNPGAAFSFLGDAGGWQRWFFTALSSLASVALLIWLTRLTPRENLLAVGLALVLGGAVGNLIDRIAYGYVIDFLDVFYRSYHWPTFNVADSAITVGVAIMLLDSFRRPESDPDQSIES